MQYMPACTAVRHAKVCGTAGVTVCAGEQTWPTEEELAAAAAAAGSKALRKRRLPAGTSEYQAAWILDEYDDDDGDDEASEEDHGELLLGHEFGRVLVVMTWMMTMTVALLRRTKEDHG